MRRAGTVVALVGSALFLATAALEPAYAESDDIQQVSDYRYVINWDKPRTNFRAGSTANFTKHWQRPETGARFSLGMRNGSGQFARAEADPGQSATLHRPNGSAAMPRGTFYLNTFVGGACGSPCGPITWNITFRWNV